MAKSNVEKVLSSAINGYRTAFSEIHKPGCACGVCIALTYLRNGEGSQ